MAVIGTATSQFCAVLLKPYGSSLFDTPCPRRALDTQTDGMWLCDVHAAEYRGTVPDPPVGLYVQDLGFVPGFGVLLDDTDETDENA